MRTAHRLAGSVVACAAGFFACGIVGNGQLPAENARAESPSGLTLTCEVFCSQTKMRTGTARLRWRIQPATRTGIGLATLADAKQTLELSVFDQGFEKGLFVTLPISQPGPGSPIAALAQGKPPTLRAYQVQLVAVERTAVAADAANEMSVLVENLEAGMNYSWRLAISSPKGGIESAIATCKAPICPADIDRNQP
jgi:hypothetical protein